METALDRLSKIVDVDTFLYWYEFTSGFSAVISDIQEVVSLAKENHPTIDAMRFEAAKAAMQGYLANKEFTDDKVLAQWAAETGDALISELQKPKTNG